MQINDLIDRVESLEGGEALARDLRKFVNKRKLGLVYEESKPEYVRLVGKPVVEEDLVNVLPPRGTMENMSGDDDADVIWFVESIDDDKAHLVALEGEESCDVDYDDLVAVARFDQTIYCGLTETGRVERGGDRPFHAVINGENYHALELMLFPYFQSVDCIYIDPPYNTGAKDWKYNNNYVGADDAYRHSKWLTFMEDRLRLAKKLLNPENSVLIVTIDEKEYLRLGLLLEQMFPEAKTIQMISTVINPKGVAGQSGFRRADEYIFFVMLGQAAPTALPLGNEWSPSAIRSGTVAAKKKSNKREEPGWTSMMRRGSHSSRNERPGLYYAIYADPNERKIVRVGDVLPNNVSRDKDIEGLVQILPIRTNGSQGCWQVGPEECLSRIEQGRIRLGRETSYGFVVNYLPDGEYTKVLSSDYEVIGRAKDGSIIAYRKDNETVDKWVAPTQWKLASHDASAYGSSLLMTMVGGKRFSFPKSLYAVEDTLRFFVANNPDALIVDFFSGSGTTAHATMRLNHQDGGRRRSISVTNNEVSFEEAKAFVKRGLRAGDEEWESHGIARYVTIPRVTAAITGLTPEGEPIKGDYKFTDEFPMADGFEENAVFYDLKYLEPAVITANLAFDEIAPLLWMRAGSVGPMITLGDEDPEDATYEVTDTYGVLFDYAYSPEFIEECRAKDVDHIFVVTDIDRQYRDMCAEFRGKDVKQLYKSYLRSFEIGQDR